MAEKNSTHQQSLVKAFYHAFNGAGYFIRYDRNAKIHLAAAILVVIAGVYFGIAIMEWCILFLCMGLVISFEMLNHALETLCDVVHEAHHPLIKTVKDVAAAAVLCSAITSAMIGLVIFIPKIYAVL